MDALDTVPQRAPCPSRADLAAFSGGDLPPPALEAIAGHLAGCPQCLTTLETLARGAASTLRDLRGSLQDTVPDPFADEPEYRRMEGAAITLYSSWTEPRPGDAATPELTPPFALGQYQV